MVNTAKALIKRMDGIINPATEEKIADVVNSNKKMSFLLLRPQKMLKHHGQQTSVEKDQSIKENGGAH